MGWNTCKFVYTVICLITRVLIANANRRCKKISVTFQLTGSIHFQLKVLDLMTMKRARNQRMTMYLCPKSLLRSEKATFTLSTVLKKRLAGRLQSYKPHFYNVGNVVGMLINVP